MKNQKPTVKAMVLHYHYRNTFFHSLTDIMEHEEFGQWWEEMDNFNRTYVLKGKVKKGKRWMYP